MTGRPLRYSADYFPYIVKYGKTMRYIESKYGNDGYATWVKILEQLTVTDYHYLDLNDPDTLLDLAGFCNIEEELLLRIIKDIAKRRNFDKHLWFEHKIVWSPKFIEKIQRLYTRRENDCLTLEELYGMLGLEKPEPAQKRLPVDVPGVKVYEKELEEIMKYFPNKLSPQTEKQKDGWRKCIRLLLETDKYQYNQVIDIIKWGRKKGNWWHDNGNFLSLLKLRNKNKDKIKYIEIFIEQMKGKPSKKEAISDIKNFSDKDMNYEEN